MLIRGGLLIEPWKSYKKYTNNPRNQDVILFENTIYVCSVAHISGATFSENADKFISPGASGTGGGSGVSYGGEWDLYDSQIVLGDTITQDIVLQTGFGSEITNNVVTVTTPVLLPGSGSINIFGSVTENIVTNFTTTRWLTASVNAPSYFSLFLTEQAVTDYPSFFYDIIGLNTSNSSLIGIVSSFVGTQLGYTVIVYDKPTEQQFTYDIPISYPNNVNFQVGLNADNTITIIANGIEHIINSSVNFPPNLSKLLTFDLVIPSSPSNHHTLGSFTDVGKLPLQQIVQNVLINPPIGALDGVLYTVVNNGTFNNTVLVGGETIVFYNNLTDILIIDAPIDENSLVTLINNTIDTSINQGAIYNKLLYVNTKGSVPYTINKYNEPSGLLEFSDVTSNIVNMINVQVNGGLGRIYSTRFSTSVFGKGEFVLKVNTNRPTILYINGTNNALLQTINLTPNQQCTVVLAELVQNQISILSLDITGETTFSSPSTYVPLTTSNIIANNSITSRGMGSGALVGNSLGLYGNFPPEYAGANKFGSVIDLGVVNNARKFTFTFNTIVNTAQYYCLSNHTNIFNHFLKLGNTINQTVPDGMYIYCTSSGIQVHNLFNSQDYTANTIPLPSLLGGLRVDVEINIPELRIVVSFPTEGPEKYTTTIPVLPFMYSDQPVQYLDRFPHLVVGTLYLTNTQPLSGFISFSNGVDTNKTPIGSWVNATTDELIIDYLIANNTDIVINYVRDYNENFLIPFFLRGTLVTSGRYKFKDNGAGFKGVYKITEQYDTIKTFTATSNTLEVGLGVAGLFDNTSSTKTVLIRDPNNTLTTLQVELPFVTELVQLLEIILPSSPINITFTHQTQTGVVYNAYNINGTYSNKVTLLFTYNPITDCSWEVF